MLLSSALWGIGRVTVGAVGRNRGSIKEGFEQWEMIACIDQTRNGRPLRQLRIFACTNYLDPGVK